MIMHKKSSESNLKNLSKKKRNYHFKTVSFSMILYKRAYGFLDKQKENTRDKRSFPPVVWA